MLALCFCVGNLKQIKTDQELISFLAKHIVRLITGLMSSSPTKGETGINYWNFGHLFFFCLQVCDTQNVVKTARLFFMRCLFRGRFLFQTWVFIFFKKNLSRNSIFYWCCCPILLLHDNEKWETKIHVALFNLSSSESHVCFSKKFSNYR